MSSPDAYILSRENWQLFATLTFESRSNNGQLIAPPVYAARVKMLFAFLHEVAEQKRNEQGKRIQKVHWSRFLFAARDEEGEMWGREHFHVLIGGLPLERCNAVERWVTRHSWKLAGGGFADVRRFETSLRGVDYVLKGLDQWSRAGANAYELGKFTQGEERRLIIANGFVKKWAGPFYERRAARRTGNTEISGPSLSDRRKLIANRTKETPAYKGGLFIPNRHPAGVSFVQ